MSRRIPTCTTDICMVGVATGYTFLPIEIPTWFLAGQHHKEKAASLIINE